MLGQRRDGHGQCFASAMFDGGGVVRELAAFLVDQVFIIMQVEIVPSHSKDLLNLRRQKPPFLNLVSSLGGSGISSRASQQVRGNLRASEGLIGHAPVAKPGNAAVMIEHHLARLRFRHPISVEEEAAIRGMIGETRRYPAGTVIVHAMERLNVSLLLLDGMLGRYKDLRSGERQISELHLAGDFADLHSYTLKRLDHNILALTACQVAVVPHENIKKVVRAFPRLGDLFWFSTNLDAAIHREWMVSLGRRSAVARIAALFCELQARLSIIGKANEAGFDLPLNQSQLAECLGITSVHVNRVLRELRERGLATFRSQRVSILDLAGLRGLGEFDPAYLYLKPEPL